MQRTQVFLAEEEVELLDRAVASSGASRSELIRRAIRPEYGDRDVEAKLSAVQSSFGAWRGWHLTGEEYVDAVRGDLNERLRTLGWS